MKAKIEISYNQNTDNTSVKLDKSFKELTFLERADFLSDAIYLLNEIYHKNLDKWHKSKKL